jgi:hypothetical protein
LQVLIAFTQNVVHMKICKKSFGMRYCCQSLCKLSLQSQKMWCKWKFAKRAFECVVEHLHPTKVLEQWGSQDLWQGRQPIGVCRFWGFGDQSSYFDTRLHFKASLIDLCCSLRWNLLKVEDKWAPW